MKKTLLIIMTLGAFTVYGQQQEHSYKIEGTLIGAKDGDQVYLMRGSRNEPATIENEKFVLNFTMAYPDLIRIMPPGGGILLRMFVEPGTVKLVAELGAWTNATLEGDGVKDWNFYLNAIRLYGERQALVETIKAHPDAPLSGFLINTFLSAQEDYELSKGLYDGLSEKGRQSHHAQLFAPTLERQGKLAESKGQKAPAFTLIDREGKTCSLADYTGKYIILDFWGSWCGPCRQSHPHLIELYHTYKDKNFDIIGLASERGSDEAWLKAIEEDGLPWRQVNLKTNETGQELLNNYNVRAFPTKILINPEGEIVVFYVGNSSELDAKLKEIFAR